MLARAPSTARAAGDRWRFRKPPLWASCVITLHALLTFVFLSPQQDFGCDENAVAFPSLNGAKVVSQGRQPLDPESRVPFSQAPAGVAVGCGRWVPCRTVLSPLTGLRVAWPPFPRGSRPWLTTGAPTGAACLLPRADANVSVLQVRTFQSAIRNLQSAIEAVCCGRRSRCADGAAIVSHHARPGVGGSLPPDPEIGNATHAWLRTH